MFVKQNLDYLPHGHFEETAELNHSKQLKKLQHHKWLVLAGTFFIVFILANLFIWTRPSLYQSQAILQFMTSSPLGEKNSGLEQQYLDINHKRLLSNNLIYALSEYLHATYQLEVSYPELVHMLSVKTSEFGSIVTLEARGQNGEQLKTIVDSWVNNYIKNLRGENQIQNSDEVIVLQEQLQGLELKIIEQRTILESFAIDKNIISLVRDENQILRKIKGLSTNLDTAEAEKNQALANLDSLNSAIKSGEVIIAPDDKALINESRAKLQTLSEELSALNDNYTAEYMARDPLIVAKQKAKEELENGLKQQINVSQLNYLQDSQRILETASNKVSLIQDQLSEQRRLAQTFNQQLDQYQRLSNELEDLQLQKQTLQGRLVELELVKPFEVKTVVLEPASRAEFPIGPNYWRDTFFALILAASLALLALFIYGYIARPTTERGGSPNIVVVPQYNPSATHLLREQSHQQEQAVEPSLSIANAVSLRILNINESKALYQAANKQGKALIGLLYCGVSLDEIEHLNKSHFATSFAQLNMNGTFSREIVIPQELATLLKEQCAFLDDNQSIWPKLRKESDLQELLINTAYDAELELPELVSLAALRHTYIGYLVDQGARLNEVELLCGYIAPSSLSHFRQAKKLAKTTPLEQIQTVYPFITI